MSEEPGVVNVEDDGPAITADDAAEAGTPLAAGAEQAPPVPDDEAAAEVEAVEVAGKKYVPVGAVIAERKQRQALQQKADRADELERYVNDSRPYVEFLKANPDILKPRQAPPAPVTFGAPADDPQEVALAQTLDLYTPEGKPDTARARTIRTMMTTTAQQIAQQAIGPLHERTHQDQSARNFQIALTVKDADGTSPSQESLLQIWRTMPAHQTADPNVASILALTAIGLDRVTKKKVPAAPVGAPVVTEGQGGQRPRGTLSQLESNVARERGISDTKWQENTRGWVAGRPTTLED